MGQPLDCRCYTSVWDGGRRINSRAQEGTVSLHAQRHLSRDDYKRVSQNKGLGRDFWISQRKHGSFYS